MLGAVMVFRDVTEQKKLRQQVELADRLSSLGTMAAGAAHELNNPLAVIVSNAGFVVEDLRQHRADLRENDPLHLAEQRLDAIAESLGDLQSAASRMARIISDLGTFSRPAEHPSEALSLARCVEWAVRTTAHEFQHRARLLTQLGETPPVRADEARLGQVLINLLINAAQAIPPGHADRNEVNIATRTDEQGRAVIEVRDTGAGIPPEELSRIFEPFFTTKPVGSGTGLGLSICHGIVSSLDGEMQVDSEIGKGTIFRVLLPAAPAERIGTSPAPGVSEIIKVPHGRVLVVDDDVMMLRAVERILNGVVQDVICKDSAQEALKLIEKGDRFDAILSDMMMPTMTGMEFYETLVGQNPDLARRVIFFSGGAITVKVDAFLQSVPNLKVAKPFRIANLREAIQQVIACGPAAVRL